jgi:hypothetical protein
MEARASTLRMELTGNVTAGNFIGVDPPRLRGIRKLPRASHLVPHLKEHACEPAP